MAHSILGFLREKDSLTSSNTQGVVALFKIWNQVYVWAMLKKSCSQRINEILVQYGAAWAEVGGGVINYGVQSREVGQSRRYCFISKNI